MPFAALFYTAPASMALYYAILRLAFPYTYVALCPSGPLRPLLCTLSFPCAYVVSFVRYFMYVVISLRLRAFTYVEFSLRVRAFSYVVSSLRVRALRT